MTELEEFTEFIESFLETVAHREKCPEIRSLRVIDANTRQFNLEVTHEITRTRCEELHKLIEEEWVKWRQRIPPSQLRKAERVLAAANCSHVTVIDSPEFGFETRSPSYRPFQIVNKLTGELLTSNVYAPLIVVLRRRLLFLGPFCQNSTKGTDLDAIIKRYLLNYKCLPCIGEDKHGYHLYQFNDFATMSWGDHDLCSLQTGEYEQRCVSFSVAGKSPLPLILNKIRRYSRLSHYDFTISISARALVKFMKWERRFRIIGQHKGIIRQKLTNWQRELHSGECG